MPETRSINQNIQPKLLPRFRNLGTIMRIVLLVNVIALFAAVAQAESFTALQGVFLQASALMQPVLLASLLLLYAVDPLLARLAFWHGALAITAIVVAVTGAIDVLGGDLFAMAGDFGKFRYVRHALDSLGVTILLLAYFRMRAQELSPAKHEARLQALQARIRPHFLFNSINAVLSIVRADPRRAETVLEDMADLFRMAMTEPRELVELNREIELARQYLAIEELRLGERLQVDWDMQGMPVDALIPPLVLQPLLENAVYHGVEPLPEGGRIGVRLYLENDVLHLEVSNPAPAQAKPRVSGNRMALSNIRERLALLFDVEAQYQVDTEGGFYRVHIRIPYLKAHAT